MAVGSSGRDVDAPRLITFGAIQTVFAVAILLNDVISIALYWMPATGRGWIGFLLAPFFIITGSITIAAGTQSRKAGNCTRCLSISALVLSILAILTSLLAITMCILSLIQISEYERCYYDSDCYRFWYGPAIYSLQMIFYVAVIVVSVVVCVFAVRASRKRSKVNAGQVHYVVGEPGMQMTTTGLSA